MTGSKGSEYMAQVREEAREIGGEELVAKIDAASKSERELNAAFVVLINAASEGREGQDLQLALTAINEALSQTFANAVVRYGEASDTSDGEIMVLAIRSLSNSIQVAMSNRDTKNSGVFETIANAVSRGGKKKGRK